MSRVRTHFCTLVARGYGAGSRPVRYGMNGTIPATVNSRDGSGEISEALGTTVCPRWAKCSRKRRRISAVCIRVYSVLRGRTGSWLLASSGRRSVGGRGVGSVARPAGADRAWPSGRLRVPPGEPDLVAGGQRRVQTGPCPQLRLAGGGGGPDVGTEVTDRLGQLAQALGD